MNSQATARPVAVHCSNRRCAPILLFEHVGHRAIVRDFNGHRWMHEGGSSVQHGSGIVYSYGSLLVKCRRCGYETLTLLGSMP